MSHCSCDDMTQAVYVYRCKLGTIVQLGGSATCVTVVWSTVYKLCLLGFVQNVTRQKAHLPLRNFVYRCFIQTFHVGRVNSSE